VGAGIPHVEGDYLDSAAATPSPKVGFPHGGRATTHTRDHHGDGVAPHGTTTAEHLDTVEEGNIGGATTVPQAQPPLTVITGAELHGLTVPTGDDMAGAGAGGEEALSDAAIAMASR
jgi:hypothetical protein